MAESQGHPLITIENANRDLSTYTGHGGGREGMRKKKHVRGKG